jgi:hypothetical protein
LIGQNIGLPFLVPFAIEHLQENPLTEGDFFPGDLLCVVLRVKAEFWASHWDAHEKVEVIAKKVRELAASEGKVVIGALEEALGVFSSVTADGPDSAFKGQRAKRARP